MVQPVRAGEAHAHHAAATAELAAVFDLPAAGARASEAATHAAHAAPHAALLATAVFGLGTVTHGEVEVPRRSEGHLAALAVLGLVEEEAAPVGVCVVGQFLMQNVVDGGSEVYVIFVSGSVLAVLEEAFEVIQVLLQVFFLLLLDILFLGIVQNDVQAIGSLETFLFDTALVVVACATGIGPSLVECPDVAARKAVPGNVGFFKLAYVHAVFAALDFFDKHVHTAIHTVDIEVKVLGTGAITASLPKEPVGERVSNHAFVHIGPVENPVIGRREPEHAHVDGFALVVVDFDGVTGLGECGGGLSSHLDADIVESTLGTIGHTVCFSVQYPHCGWNFIGDIHVQAFLLGVNEDNREVIGLREAQSY